ncbi:hypothetical protein IAT38_003054 [Cryptococcus sp. DSM 104549]
MSDIFIYLNDHRYPGPAVYPPPPFITGIPTQEELDSYPKLFTWGEYKKMIMAGNFDRTSRNQHFKYRFVQWQRGIEAEYGSTVNYLKTARLPFLKPSTPSQKTPDLDKTPSSPQRVVDGKATPAPVSNRPTLESEPEYLKSGPNGEFDETKYAVLLNDWPYSLPHGVRHFCVWSTVPIAHPKLVDYDPAAWAEIDNIGLRGFTGVTPIHSSPATTQPSGPGKIQRCLKKHEWYAADTEIGENDIRNWAGVQYEMRGGHEMARMVRRLWDERGWECLWFANPPRIQTVQGFPHFHVLARRKTPLEIDASEAAFESVEKQ